MESIATGDGSSSRGNWFYAFRNPVAFELLQRHAPSFILLYVIAYRAQRTPTKNRHDLEPGEAFIGDCSDIGITRQEYRTAKKLLAKWGFASFRPTNKGTTATLLDQSVFDINMEPPNQLPNHQPTTGQPPGNHRPTTTNNEKNGKKEKKRALSPSQELIHLEKQIKKLEQEAATIKSIHYRDEGMDRAWDSPEDRSRYTQKQKELGPLQKRYTALLMEIGGVAKESFY